ncbi:MAG: MATE family efflux transporter, partial [Firmicutes bacterium]|nr:MATE family efflux transporter [Bacillota bacterium]
MRKRVYSIDMTHGPLLGKMLRFAFPLMLSSVLQLLFNAADVIVVGRFAGSSALAAVGSTGALSGLLVNLFIGLSVGANVVVARFVGANDWKDAHEAVHTSVLLSLVGGSALVVVGLVLAKPLLVLMGTPDDVLDLAAVYMRSEEHTSEL